MAEIEERKIDPRAFDESRADIDTTTTNISTNIERHERDATTAKIYCKIHKVDAEYFSAATSSYVCYECLVEEQGLIQVTE